MNLAFCLAIASRRENLSVMFHEVGLIPFIQTTVSPRLPPGGKRGEWLGYCLRADDLFVCHALLEQYSEPSLPGVRSPPGFHSSHIPTLAQASRVAAIRSEISQKWQMEARGDFGTYGCCSRPSWSKSCGVVRARRNMQSRAYGGNGAASRRRCSRNIPRCASHRGVGHLPAEEVSAYLAACSVAFSHFRMHHQPGARAPWPA